MRNASPFAQVYHGVRVLRLIPAADGEPGVWADRRRELLQFEPGAGLIGADLKGDALSGSHQARRQQLGYRLPRDKSKDDVILSEAKNLNVSKLPGGIS